jgi:hypothetical protein
MKITMHCRYLALPTLFAPCHHMTRAEYESGVKGYAGKCRDHLFYSCSLLLDLANNIS